MQQFSISPEYQEAILSEIAEYVTDYLAEDAESGDTFIDALEAWYGNLWDDLHDSKGDQEYQQEILERMQVTEQSFPTIITPISDEDKLAEAPWAE